MTKRTISEERSRDLWFGALAAAIALPAAVIGFGAPLWLGLIIALVALAAVALIRPRLRAGVIVEGEVVSPALATPLKVALGDAAPAIARLEAAAKRIGKAEARDRVARLAKAGRLICADLEADPSGLPSVQRLLTYYLPRAAEMAEGYADLESPATAASPRLLEVEAVLEKLEDAFRHYAQLLHEDDLRGLDAEMKLIREALDEDLRR
jgi:hypothetical protein